MVIEWRGSLSYTVQLESRFLWRQHNVIDQLRDGVNVSPESDVEAPRGGLSSQASTGDLSRESQTAPETPTTSTDTTDSTPAENANTGEPNRTESRYPRRVHRPPQRYSEQNY